MEPIGTPRSERSDEWVAEVAFQAAGAATRPLLEDHPDYVFPSERVSRAVAELLREGFGIHTERDSESIATMYRGQSMQVGNRAETFGTRRKFVLTVERAVLWGEIVAALRCEDVLSESEIRAFADAICKQLSKGWLKGLEVELSDARKRPNASVSEALADRAARTQALSEALADRAARTQALSEATGRRIANAIEDVARRV